MCVNTRTCEWVQLPSSIACFPNRRSHAFSSKSLTAVLDHERMDSQFCCVSIADPVMHLGSCVRVHVLVYMPSCVCGGRRAIN